MTVFIFAAHGTGRKTSVCEAEHSGWHSDGGVSFAECSIGGIHYETDGFISDASVEDAWEMVERDAITH